MQPLSSAKKIHRAGIEPTALPKFLFGEWEGNMLPLHQRCYPNGQVSSVLMSQHRRTFSCHHLLSRCPPRPVSPYLPPLRHRGSGDPQSLTDADEQLAAGRRALEYPLHMHISPSLTRFTFCGRIGGRPLGLAFSDPRLTDKRLYSLQSTRSPLGIPSLTPRLQASVEAWSSRQRI
jgi:hypothetical protein